MAISAEELAAALFGGVFQPLAGALFQRSAAFFSCLYRYGRFTPQEMGLTCFISADGGCLSWILLISQSSIPGSII
jgi:hypothetical protein